eukprot:sb/3462704/
MKQVTGNMASVVKGLDAAMKSMNLEKMQQLMDKFEKQQEDMDVQSQAMDQSMSNTVTLSVPEDSVSALMQEVADEHGLEVGVELGGHSIPSSSVGTTSHANAEQDELSQRLARLRQQISMLVGRMLFKCQREPFLQVFFSTVTACKEVKVGKKKRYEVELDDTILFPEGGGQPSDFGTLQLPTSDAKIGVLDVQRRGRTAVHTTDKPIPVGQVVNASVDWERRFDHMQQHTGQHLLSAIAEQEPYKLNTVSWNLAQHVHETIGKAVLQPKVTGNMASVVKGLDAAMKSMNLEKMQQLMDKFEKQQEDMDVQSQAMDQSMSNTVTLSVPEDSVSALMQEVADEHGLEVGVELGGHSIPSSSVGTTSHANAEQDELSQRLARLRQQISMLVGRMLFKCQREPFLQVFFSTVTACKEVKVGKKKRYEVELDDTILFPEGGGQPSDFGTLQLPTSDAKIGVLDVQRRGRTAVHTTDKPIPVGQVVNASVDWERRFDHMQQHTGQHLLSAIAEQEPYKLNTVSWNLAQHVHETIGKAVLQPKVTGNMASVVKGLDAAMKSMNLEKMQQLMDKFEKQQEDMDVQSQAMDQSMSNTVTLSVPEDSVSALMQEVADEHGLEVGVELGGHSIPSSSVDLNLTAFVCQVKVGKKKRYEVELDDTILFPEGGGQPSDFGTLQLPTSDAK